MSIIHAVGINLVHLIPPMVLLAVIFYRQFRPKLFPVYVLLCTVFCTASTINTLMYLAEERSLIFLTVTCAVFLFAAACLLHIFIVYSAAQCFFVILMLMSNIDILTSFTALIRPLLEHTGMVSLMPADLWGPLIYTLISYPLLYVFFKKLLQPTLEYTRTLHSWNIMWIIPFCNYMIFRFSLHPSYVHSDAHGRFVPFVMPCLWTLCTFLSYIIILKMLMESMKNAALEEQLHISDIQLASQQKQTEYLQNRIANDSRTRHDIRHYLLALQGYITAGKYEDARQHLKTYLDETTPARMILYCENTILNSIMNYYMGLAEKHDISMKLSIVIPKDIPFPETDLCIIFGNLLENAMEACLRQEDPDRYIHIKAVMASSQILTIVAENSYNGVIYKRNDHFLSTKRNGREGIGISSITRLTEKHNGVIRFDYDDRKFTASILLNSRLG